MTAGSASRLGSVESVILHATCFLALGPLIAFVLHIALSALASLPTAGWAQTVSAGLDGLNLSGSIYALLALLALVIVGPAMFVTGAVVSLVSHHLVHERWITLSGFCIGAGVAMAFIPIIDQSESRLPLPWGGPTAIIVSGGAGLLMTRFTRFLRRWRDQPPEASGSGTP